MAQEAAPIFVTKIPPGYRDWKVVSVAHEEGDLKDIRAVLGNDVAIKAYRAGRLPFPEGRSLAESHGATFHPRRTTRALAVNSRSSPALDGVLPPVHGQGLQEVRRDWRVGYSSFGKDGKPSPESAMNTCFSCHQAVSARDFIFTRYSP